MTKGIYCFTNKINGKKYIGQSINIEKRYKQHLYNGRAKNRKNDTHFYRALRKYGITNFTFEILDSDPEYTRENLNELEQYYIEKYDSFRNGYNSNKGGGYIEPKDEKLTVEQILEIKDKIANSSISFKDIIKEYHLNEKTNLITQINRGEKWKNIGNYSYPIRDNSLLGNQGELNPAAKISNQQVLEIRQNYVGHFILEVYSSYSELISFSEFLKIIDGYHFKSLPVYKKNKKKWYLNGTCIDYPRVEE